MTEPEPAGPMFEGLIAVTATATVVHPEGADLSELPGHNPEADNTEQENH